MNHFTFGVDTAEVIDITRGGQSWTPVPEHHTTMAGQS
jgi:hypothetical protein